jgi:hypothetical protein
MGWRSDRLYGGRKNRFRRLFMEGVILWSFFYFDHEPLSTALSFAFPRAVVFKWLVSL